jgi:cold shock protein
MPPDRAARNDVEGGRMVVRQTRGMSEMAKGTVKWFNSAKGFGFIQPESGGPDVFVHVTAVQEAGLAGLEDNQAIEYELVDGRDGRKSAGELKLV